jgi:hypothetical protein
MIIVSSPRTLSPTFFCHHLDSFSPAFTQVAGYAIGGEHILNMVCDLTIAADNAIFGQTGPKVIIRFLCIMVSRMQNIPYLSGEYKLNTSTSICH